LKTSPSKTSCFVIAEVSEFSTGAIAQTAHKFKNSLHIPLQLQKSGELVVLFQTEIFMSAV
jgi:hypothetical protein